MMSVPRHCHGLPWNCDELSRHCQGTKTCHGTAKGLAWQNFDATTMALPRLLHYTAAIRRVLPQGTAMG